MVWGPAPAAGGGSTSCSSSTPPGRSSERPASSRAFLTPGETAAAVSETMSYCRPDPSSVRSPASRLCFPCTGPQAGSRFNCPTHALGKDSVCPPELKVRTPAHARHPGWCLEFESRVTHRHSSQSVGTPCGANTMPRGCRGAAAGFMSVCGLGWKAIAHRSDQLDPTAARRPAASPERAPSPLRLACPQTRPAQHAAKSCAAEVGAPPVGAPASSASGSTTVSNPPDTFRGD